jgi:uncharacterized membrane protein
MTQKSEARTIAIVAYLTLVGSLIAITMNAEPKHDLGRFHCRQAFGLHISFLGLAIFISSAFNFYAWAGLYLMYFVLWIYGFLGALSSRQQMIPLIGTYFQKWFTFIR